ncbi:MAG: XdhC family protein, partial [Phycisphaerae bacterium]
QEALARAHAPIGLPIGAVTTDEIAVAIAAELIQVRRKGHRQCVEGPFPVTNAT